MADITDIHKKVDEMTATVADMNRRLEEANKQKFLWITVQVGQYENALVRLNVETGESERVKL